MKKIQPDLTAGKAFATNPRYGRVFFGLRRRFGISVEECLLLDILDTLSRKTGWCFASRAYLAGLFGISERSLQRMLARLIAEDLIERNGDESRQIRPSSRWRTARRSLVR